MRNTSRGLDLRPLDFDPAVSIYDPLPLPQVIEHFGEAAWVLWFDCGGMLQ